MTLQDRITLAITPFRRYVDFKGRSGRAEYWHFQALLFLCLLVLLVLQDVLGIHSTDQNMGILVNLFLLSTVLPNLAVIVRRLRDAGRNVWWALSVVPPIIGIIAWIVIGLLKTTEQKDLEEPNE